jgi:hypothetical protein
MFANEYLAHLLYEHHDATVLDDTAMLYDAAVYDDAAMSIRMSFN